MRRLAKLAGVSARLRSGVKLAGLGGKMVDAAFRVAKRNPVNAAVGTGVAGLGAVGATGEYKKHRTGFDPTVNKLMSGQTPTPPGVT